MTARYPHISLDINTSDINKIMLLCSEAMRKNDIPEEAIEEYIDEVSAYFDLEEVLYISAKYITII